MVGRPADGAREQMGDEFLQNRVGFEADREALGFEIFIDVRCGEGGIPSEVAPQLSIPIAGDNRLQHVAPVVGAMDVPGRSEHRSRSPTC